MNNPSTGFTPTQKPARLGVEGVSEGHAVVCRYIEKPPLGRNSRALAGIHPLSSWTVRRFAEDSSSEVFLPAHPWMSIGNLVCIAPSCSAMALRSGVFYPPPQSYR